MIDPYASESDTSVDAFIDHLIASSLIGAEAGRRVKATASSSDQPFDVVVTELGLLKELTLARELSAFFSVPHLDGDDLQPDEETVLELGMEFLQQHCLLPMQNGGGTTTFVTANPLDRSGIGIVEFALEATFPIAVSTRSIITQHLDHLAQTHRTEVLNEAVEADDAIAEADLDRLQDIASQAPVIQLVKRILQSAVRMGGTDIHLEPSAQSLDVRVRVDGVLVPQQEVPKAMHAGVMTRLKVMSRLNIAESRRPQDGRMRTTVGGQSIDLRLAFLPTIHGETAVLRILDKSRAPLDLAQLGFSSDARERLQRMAAAPNGVLLATGPTGSGKTTTLYALVRQVMSPQVKVFTIEDPVEYELPGATQLQVNSEIDFTFANALRTVLRQDPDIILVGEIRDRETAEIAIRASLTGHLVLSTLHTNSAIDAIARLRDMGIENFLLATALRGVIAQRLLRRVCSQCHSGQDKLEGCSRCDGTGYQGRTVSYEIIDIQRDLAEAISAGAATSELAKLARDAGTVAMIEQARGLVEAGHTTMQEVQRMIVLDR